MATTLRLVFTAAGDKKVSFFFPCAKGTATSAQVKSLMQSIVDNGAIYVPSPLAIAEAEFVDRTTHAVDLS